MDKPPYWDVDIPPYCEVDSPPYCDVEAPPYCEVDIPPYCDVDRPPPWLVDRFRGHVLRFGMWGLLMNTSFSAAGWPLVQGANGPVEGRELL